MVDSGLTPDRVLGLYRVLGSNPSWPRARSKPNLLSVLSLQPPLLKNC